MANHEGSRESKRPTDEIVLQVPVTRVMREKLEEAVETGLWGSSVEEVARRLLERGLWIGVLEPSSDEEEG